MAANNETATETDSTTTPTADPFGDDLTTIQRDLLYAIYGTDEPNGLELKDRLERVYEVEIHHGRLYPNLDDLVEKGLVNKGELDRRTNYYELTSRGRREVEADHEWRTEQLED